ncbi:RNA exonuclease 4 [Ceratocystis fimbriata CBS 114723]|uniref:RNA exonuclease 4 n=1 Tax=Ceratocystis fimbriata CBS 114723 TaxID=1035309 RepID=A0A2C5XFK2_9PEZI|nr:RNA exonuclease 4 [Ceratocystis fimbriata CBS 114723]
MNIQGLSSNWKKLQDQMKKESLQTQSSTSKPESTKRKRTSTQPTKPSKKSRQSPSFSPVVNVQGKILAQTKMGATQSSEIDKVARPEILPSLSLWTQTEPICSDDLAAAYKLSSRTPFTLHHPTDKVNAGQTPDLELGKYVAIDCEMVGIGPSRESALARISMVDFHGRQIYDSYVRPKGKVTDWRTPVSGIEPRHMKIARTFAQVQAEVAAILQGRILVGHDLSHDLGALELRHPVKDIRDTAKSPQFRKYGNGRKPALRVLSQALLHVEIQSGAHSSVEDARVTMEIFRRYKTGFDADNASRFAIREKRSVGGGNGKKKSKR